MNFYVTYAISPRKVSKSGKVQKAGIILPLKYTQIFFHKEGWRCRRGQSFPFLTVICLPNISGMSCKLPEAPRDFQAENLIRRQFLPVKNFHKAKHVLLPKRVCNCSQNKPSISPTSIFGRPRKAKATKTGESDPEMNYGSGKEAINYTLME